MKVILPFGSGFLEENLPDVVEKYEATWTATKSSPLSSLPQAVAQAFDAPCGTAPLEEHLNSRSRVVVAFDDPTVMNFSPLREVAIREIQRRLGKLGIPKSHVQYICATALHRKFTHRELEGILGKPLVEELGERLFCHDAEAEEDIVELGETPEGHIVEVSRFVVESDLTIYINANSLRGLSGGWKSVCVGLSTYRSIAQHHTPTGLSAKLQDNPLHKILDAMGDVVEEKLGKDRIFKLDVITRSPFEVTHIFAGNTRETRARVLEVLLQGRPAPHLEEEGKADILIYGVPAFSPYAIYSEMNPLLTLFSTALGYLGGEIERLGRPGCSVILATPCPNTWHPLHHAAYPPAWEKILEVRDPWVWREEFESKFAQNEEYLRKYREEYSFHPVHGFWAAHPIRRMAHCHKIYVVGAEDPKLISAAGFYPAESISAALNNELRERGNSALALLIEHRAN